VEERIYNLVGVGCVAKFDLDVRVRKAILWLHGRGLFVALRYGYFDEFGFGLRHLDRDVR
jgi:hypothetical protein